MKLEDLAKEAASLDAAAFKKKYPAPALVLQLSTPTPPAGPFGMKLKPKTEDAGGGGPAKKPGFDTIHGLKEVLGKASPGKVGTSEVLFLQKRAGAPKTGAVSVGRADENDVPIAQKTVSNVHAHFIRDGSSWKVADQGSSNGTFVDEERLPARGSAKLTNGTRVGFGPNVRAKFWTPQGLYDFLAIYRTGVDDL
ncbi:FHA domain-containing protein [bacterium]|nr:FHA domain-containing protein [bacterium]